MIRIAILFAVACLIFGVGGVLGAGGHLFNKAKGAAQAVAAECQKPDDVQAISFSATKYPHIQRHYRHALREGWPEVLTLNRKDADKRRDQALEHVPSLPGKDRDEYPPAVGRKWVNTDVEPVPVSENRSHGATMGIKLRRFCDGVRFKYVFY